MVYENIVVPGERPQALPAGTCAIAVNRSAIETGYYQPVMYDSPGNEVIVEKRSAISHNVMYDIGNGDSIVTAELRHEVWCWATENLGSFHETEHMLCFIVSFADEEDVVAFMLKYG